MGRGDRSLLYFKARERTLRRCFAEQRAGIFVDWAGYFDRRDRHGNGIGGVPVVRALFWELDLCLGKHDFGSDGGFGGWLWFGRMDCGSKACRHGSLFHCFGQRRVSACDRVCNAVGVVEIVAIGRFSWAGAGNGDYFCAAGDGAGDDFAFCDSAIGASGPRGNYRGGAYLRCRRRGALRECWERVFI